MYMGDKEPNPAARRATDRETGQLFAAWRQIGDGYLRTHRQVVAAVERNGVSAQWFEVLVRLNEAPDRRLPMSRLAAEVSMTSGGLTKLVDRLERAGLTERQNDPNDRRIVHTALTDRGRAAIRLAVATYAAVLRETVLPVLEPAKVADMGAMLGRLSGMTPPAPTEVADGD
jgi:DNA-binding MarR family transcriptional regulator